MRGQLNKDCTNKMTTSKFQIAQNLSSSKKQLASSLILSFKWNETQKYILAEISKKGYIVGNYNEIAAAFGNKISSNHTQKAIFTINCFGGRKKDLMIFAI
jgi:hypothetical protein